MMKQMKVMTGAVFAVVMLVAMGSTAHAQVTGVDVPFALQCRQELDGKITITGYTGRLRDIVIPGTINGLPVAYIGGAAFYEKALTSVVIPASVTYIGRNAFSNGYYPNVPTITSITIGANVELDSSGLGGFDDAYNNGGKQAGTYTRDGETWTKQ